MYVVCVCLYIYVYITPYRRVYILSYINCHLQGVHVLRRISFVLQITSGYSVFTNIGGRG